ncbi:MAG TPA: hypothetical protein VEL07_12535, partial [Planctomycetota bacterium]|nr:hypothetical protein [Planctomycetota bacterium]
MSGGDAMLEAWRDGDEVDEREFADWLRADAERVRALVRGAHLDHALARALAPAPSRSTPTPPRSRRQRWPL